MLLPISYNDSQAHPTVKRTKRVSRLQANKLYLQSPPLPRSLAARHYVVVEPTPIRTVSAKSPRVLSSCLATWNRSTEAALGKVSLRTGPLDAHTWWMGVSRSIVQLTRRYFSQATSYQPSLTPSHFLAEGYGRPLCFEKSVRCTHSVVCTG